MDSLVSRLTGYMKRKNNQKEDAGILWQEVHLILRNKKQVCWETIQTILHILYNNWISAVIEQLN